MALTPVSAAQLIFDISEVNEISTGSNICDLEIYDNVLFSLDMQFGLETYDISNLTDPEFLGVCIDSYNYGHALVLDELRSLAYVADYEDGLEIVGKQKIKGGKIETYHDHRIAMSFAIAGLAAENDIEMDDRDCVSVSFPRFWETLDEITC